MPPTEIPIQPRNFSLAFEQMCNIVAIAGTTDANATLQKLVQQCFLLEPTKTFRDNQGFRVTLDRTLGLEVSEAQIQRALDSLVEQGQLLHEIGNYAMPMQTRTELQEAAGEAQALEDHVRQDWLSRVASTHPTLGPDVAWEALRAFLARVFRRHGVQAVRLLDPASKLSADHEKSLGTLLDEAVNVHAPADCAAECREAVASFLVDIQADPRRVKYITQLANTAFNYFSLAVPPEVSESFRQRLEGLTVFFDTNVLFGLIGLNLSSHPIASRLVSAVKENRLPFRLRYHAATDRELRGTIVFQAERLRRQYWPQGISEAAVRAGRVEGVALRYHQRNLEAKISVADFLRPYEHPDVLLKDQGLDIYHPHGVPDGFVKHVEYEYQAYLAEFKKDKAPELIRHDAEVLATAHAVRRERSSLAIGSLLVTLDHTLYRFDQRFSKDAKLEPVAVMPETFLQVLRPYLAAKQDYDTAFAQAFAFPEFRTLPGKVAEAHAKLLSVMAAYEGLSEEVASRILSNRVLIEQISGNQTDEEIREAFEHALGEEAGMLAEHNKSLQEVAAQREQVLFNAREEAAAEAKQRQALAAELSATQRAREEEARRAQTEREAMQEDFEARLVVLNTSANSKIDDLQNQFKDLEASNLRVKTRLEASERKADRQAANFIIACAALLIGGFLWAARLGPLSFLQQHANVWTIEAGVVVFIIAGAVGWAAPKVRLFCWTVVALSAGVVLLQALGGPASFQQTGSPQP